MSNTDYRAPNHRAVALALALAATACADELVEPAPHGAPSMQQAAMMMRQAADRTALVTLYEATGGPDWTRNDNWLSDEPLQDWYGIAVDDDDRVTGIRLRENGLEGSLPAELGDLAGLRFLQLSDNKLNGPIPPELGGLERLGALFLGDNDLSGPLPGELTELDSLIGIWVANNEIEGVVPAGFKDLGLLFFDIAGNDGLCLPASAGFADWVDRLLFFGGSWCGEEDAEVLRALYEATGGENWTNSDGWLEGLNASGWHGVETDSVGRVAGLVLSSNGLSGLLPAKLVDLAHLIELDLSGNRLGGRLPERLGDLAKLVSLNLSRNYFSGPLPLSLRNTALEELKYEYTRLCVPDDGAFRNWLGSLAVHDGTGDVCAPLSDREILAAFYEATGGEHWNNSGNWLTDAPLGQWYGVRTDADGHVIGLYLGSNFLSGKIPAEFGGLIHLERLDLAFNYFLEGPVPPEFFDLTELRYLRLYRTSLSGPLPSAIGRLARLETLDWGRSGLTGPVPPELGRLAQLRHLRIGSNSMVGEIPRQLGSLTRLVHLDLQSNRLTGPLPPELARLPALEYLRLGDNRLSGRIPAELGDLTGLSWLDLRENELTGSLPPELGELAHLEALHVGGNILEGVLPEAFGGLGELEYLEVDGNPELSGAVPASLAGLDNLYRFMAGGTGLCAPRDAQFLAWLKDIPEHRLARCHPAAAYLTQAVQSREFPVSLVAGRPALLRVFLASEHADGEELPEARATFHAGGREIHVAEIAAGGGTIPKEVDEGSLASSVNADIPGRVVRPGLEMVIDIDPNGTLDPGLGIPRRIPETGRMAVEVTTLPDFQFTLVPFLYESDPDSAVLEITAGMAGDPWGHPMLFETRTLLPVGGMDVRLHDPVVSSSNSGFVHLDEVTLIRELEGGSGYWMALRTPVTSGLLGVAYVPGWTSWSLPLSPTIAHELGHNLSLRHAACGGPSGIDPSYPNATGVIGSWGYNREENRLVSPYSPDIQSYCGSQWIGEYHRTKSLGHRVGTEAAAARGSRTRSLLVWGGLDAGGNPFLESSFIAEVAPSPPPPGNDYVARGRTVDGDEAFSVRFGMPVMADGDGERTGFVLAVPVTWEGALESISLAGRPGSFTLDEDTNRPITILRDPVTGQVRAILRRSAEQAMAALGEPGMEVLFSRGIPR